MIVEDKKHTKTEKNRCNSNLSPTSSHSVMSLTLCGITLAAPEGLLK